MFMILPDYELAELANAGMITPYDTACINPASIDLKLGYSFVDLVANQQETFFDNYTLIPGVPILASTLEYIKLPSSLAGMVLLKSSLARQGLDHALAGWIDPGFEGNITLELHAHRPIVLRSRQRIIQIVCYQMKTPPNVAYNGKYQGQKGPTQAR